MMTLWSPLVLVLCLVSVYAAPANHLLRIFLPQVTQAKLQGHRQAHRYFQHVRINDEMPEHCASDTLQTFLAMVSYPNIEHINASSVLPCTEHGCAGGTMEELFERYSEYPLCRDSCEKMCAQPVLRVRSTIIAYGDEEEHMQSWIERYGPIAVAVDTSSWGDAVYITPKECPDRPEPDVIGLVVGYSQHEWAIQLPWGRFHIKRGQKVCGIGSAVYVVSSKELF